MIRLLALVACALTVCIAGSSAFIRHWQGGLGCDGWPECYRKAGAARVATGDAATGAARGLAGPGNAALPRPLRAARVIHRASAAIVGVLVLVVSIAGWRSMGRAGRIAAAVALVVTAFLGWLGPYSRLDLPLVTLGNLLGGLVLAAALARVAAARRVSFPGVPPLALGGLALLALLAWGGTMIGARHAIDACATPACVAGARLDLAAFDPLRVAYAVDAAGAQGLHLAHRLVALAVSALALLLAARLRSRQPAVAWALVALVAVQWVAGMGTTLGIQPLWAASVHSASAALLAAFLASAHGRVPGPPDQDSRSAPPSSARSA